MNAFAFAFLACAALVAYPYFLYPLLLGLWARLRPRPLRASAPLAGPVSIIVAAYNEEANVDRRLGEMVALLERTGIDGEVLFVSDGSTDDTVTAARGHAKRYVRVLALPERRGKSAALAAGAAEAAGAVLVFADMRQSWAPDALELMLENFADPDVGAVSGDLVVVAEGPLAGVGLYWKFEKWLRRQESAVWGQVGVTGAICAVRRELFRAPPPGTLLDDVYWPLCVAMQGKRVVHDCRALAYDRLPDRPRDELRRKARTQAGLYQLAALLPAALCPWRNPVWLQLVSHKLLRLAVPWALLGMLGLSFFLPGPFAPAAVSAQAAGYALGLVGLLPGVARRFRPASVASSFLVLNAAAWLAFWVWASGRAGQSWHRVTYGKPAPAGGGGGSAAPAPLSGPLSEGA
jgi:cellulose synthase/poly-beta-1,6-N-acetylglucosamine synthase-like glycosyltransferase